jgi:serine/threonine protein phosphatase 1
MIENNKIICNPLNDNKKRFLLGKTGTVELLAIGLNPSKANEEKLDPTSRNIEKIALQNGCDGWWLVNLYPKRAAKPIHLPKKSKSEVN